MHKRGYAPASRFQLAKYLRLSRQMPVAEADIEFTIGKGGFEEMIEGKTVFGALPVEHIVKEQYPFRRRHRGKQAKNLPA
jgi:hypothetical protein